jgi:hypothetical protein
MVIEKLNEIISSENFEMKNNQNYNKINEYIQKMKTEEG